MDSQNTKNKIVILGDSTIDNRVWLGLEPLHLVIGTGRPILTSIVNFIARLNPFSTKSVVENLRAQMPDIDFIDRTNDGFTTGDIINGASRDKVFGEGTHRFFSSERFKPLDSTEIENADQIILSVGGNNFREFIQRVSRIRNPQIRNNYIAQNYQGIFDGLLMDYKRILSNIVARNPNANIILMTQYYPAIHQKTLLGTSIYDFMFELGILLRKGDAEATIIEVIKDTYNGILKHIAEDEAMRNINISVVDITSSLNPNLSANFVGQIEPSAKGGAQIAKMLAYAINQANIESKKIYRFAPDFFTKSSLQHVYTQDITADAPYIPVRPSSMQKPVYKGQSRALMLGSTLLLGAIANFAGFGLIVTCIAGIAGLITGKMAAQGLQLGHQTCNQNIYRFEANVSTPSITPMQSFGIEAAKGWLPYLKSSLPFSGAHNNEDFDRGYVETLKNRFKM